MVMAMDLDQGGLALDLDGPAVGNIAFRGEAFVDNAAAEGGVTQVAMGLFNGTLENGDQVRDKAIVMPLSEAMGLWGNDREHIAGLVVENVHVNLRGPIEYEALRDSFYEVQVQMYDPSAPVYADGEDAAANEDEGDAAADGEGAAEGMMVEGAN